MIEIQIPTYDDSRCSRYMIESIDFIPTDIPYFDPDTFSTYYFILEEPLRVWFQQTNIRYSLRMERLHSYYIVFEKESDAVLFKLVWGGQ